MIFRRKKDTPPWGSTDMNKSNNELKHRNMQFVFQKISDHSAYIDFKNLIFHITSIKAREGRRVSSHKIIDSQATTFKQHFYGLNSRKLLWSWTSQSSHENKSRSHKILISKTLSWSPLVSFLRSNNLCCIRFTKTYSVLDINRLYIHAWEPVALLQLYSRNLLPVYANQLDDHLSQNIQK